jgi:hypothetical protein
MTTKIIKYYYCCASSIALKNTLPEKPTGAVSWFPLPRKLALILKRRMCKGKLRAITFAMNLNHSRKSAVKVPETFETEQIEKYSDALQKIPEVRPLKGRPQKRVICSLKPISFSEVIKASCSFLSTSACAEKHDLGQVGYVNDIAPKISLDLVLDQRYQGICPAPYFAYALVPEEISGKACFLPEPLKIRCITTQNAMEFTAGKPFQECLARRMKEHPNLLYGRMVKEADIETLVSRSYRYWQSRGFRKEDLYFVSGDYEAATDNISPRTSSIIDQSCFYLGLLPDFDVDLDLCTVGMWGIMAKVFQYLPIEGPNSSKKNWYLVNLYFKAGIDKFGTRKCSISQIRKRLWKDREIEIQKDIFITQTFGQMMGDIKSFPVLCLLNLMLWDEVCENVSVIEKSFSGRILTKIDPPCLVNGDDFLAYAPKAYIKRYFDIAKEFDFKLSVGKTYISKRVGVINSRPFIYNKKNNAREIVIRFINLCLRQDPTLPLSGNLDIVTDMRKPAESLEMFKTFVKFNKQAISNATRNGLLNLFISRDLGGLGCTPREGIKIKVTRKQAIVANRAKRGHRLGLPKRHIFTSQLEWRIKMKSRKKGLILHGTNESGIKERGLGLGASYSCSTRTRSLVRDDWVSKMSRPKFFGKGYFREKNSTHKFRRIFHDNKVKFSGWNYMENETELFNYRKPVIAIGVPLVETHVREPLHPIVEKFEAIYHRPKLGNWERWAHVIEKEEILPGKPRKDRFFGMKKVEWCYGGYFTH